MNEHRTQILVDHADPARISALNSVLGIADARPRPFAHQVFFWDARTSAELGEDGHPKTGDGLIPDMGLPRRMWAGGELEFLKDLTPNQPLQKRSKCVLAQHKSGRSGQLGFVTLAHEIWQDNTLCLREHQDLVYRQPFDPGAPHPNPPQAPADATRTRSKTFTTTELFRYSALTHNGHRIHYDRDYARTAEGYAGLVVHGPLLAQYLMLMAQEMLGTLSRFTFRATSPLMDFEPALFAARPAKSGLTLWVAGPDGRQCLTASAQ